jgi:hypothetical protein
MTSYMCVQVRSFPVHHSMGLITLSSSPHHHISLLALEAWQPPRWFLIFVIHCLVFILILGSFWLVGFSVLY